MTKREIENAPLPILVGYLVSIYGDCDCECLCKPEIYCEWKSTDGEKESRRMERVCKEIGKYDNCIERAAYERVMEAVMKQVPKKVAETCGIYSCTSCHMAHDRRKKRYLKYCPNCGQRLDWSEVNG